MYAAGDYTLAQVRTKINAMGLAGVRGGTLSKGNYHRLFQNPIYCGLIRHQGELHEGRHEPLITKALFETVQQVMKTASRPKSKASKGYLYKGMFTCGECGCMVTNERQKGYVYLRCTKKRGVCSQPYLREDEMNRQVSEALLSVSLQEKDANWMLKLLHARPNRERKTAEKAATSIREDMERLNGRRYVLCGHVGHVSASR